MVLGKETPAQTITQILYASETDYSKKLHYTIVLAHLLYIIFTDKRKLLGSNPACKITTDEKHT